MCGVCRGNSKGREREREGFSPTPPPPPPHHSGAILPIRNKGNWLLCTLLIANTVANVFLPILIESFAGGVVSFVVSTILTLILAEIVPQAVCSRYGLFLAAHMTYAIWALMTLLAPVAWPLSWLLDKALGREVGTIYSRAELKHLITIHVENPEHREESGSEFVVLSGVGGWEREGGRIRESTTTLTPSLLPLPPVTREDYKVLSGALDIRDKRVRDVMTRMDRVFALDSATRLTFDNMLSIYRSGYTRIPVYDGHAQNIIGILYTKDLILIDPDDEVEVRAIVALQGTDAVQFILDVTPLNEVFKLFKTCGTHLMVACRLKDGGSAMSGGLGGTEGEVPVSARGESPAAAAAAAAGAAAAAAAAAGGDTHHAFSTVRSQQSILASVPKEVTGVVSLEDVIEEVIQGERKPSKRERDGKEGGRHTAHTWSHPPNPTPPLSLSPDEIVDETDTFETNEQTVRVARGGRGGRRASRPDVATFLSLFDHKLRDASALSSAEVQAVAAFLATSVKEFSRFAAGGRGVEGVGAAGRRSRPGRRRPPRLRRHRPPRLPGRLRGRRRQHRQHPPTLHDAGRRRRGAAVAAAAPRGVPSRRRGRRRHLHPPPPHPVHPGRALLHHDPGPAGARARESGDGGPLRVSWGRGACWPPKRSPLIPRPRPTSLISMPPSSLPPVS